MFPVHAMQVYEWSRGEPGLFFSTLSILMVGVQGALMGFLSGRVGEVPLIVGGSAIPAISFVVLIFGAPLLALGNCVIWPSSPSIFRGKCKGMEHPPEVPPASSDVSLAVLPTRQEAAQHVHFLL